MKAWIITAKIRFIMKNDPIITIIKQNITPIAGISESIRSYRMLFQSSVVVILKTTKRALPTLSKFEIP